MFPSGDICIRTERANNSRGDAYNITPLLALYKRYPDLPLSFRIGRNAAHNLNVLRDFRGIELWCETFEDKVEAVELRARRLGEAAYIVVALKADPRWKLTDKEVNKWMTALLRRAELSELRGRAGVGVVLCCRM